MRFSAVFIVLTLLTCLFGSGAQAQNITSASGTFSQSVTATPVTAVAVGDEVWCQVGVYSPPPSNNSFFSLGNERATLSSGKYICNINIPFNWVGGVGSATNPVSVQVIVADLNTSITNLVVVQSGFFPVRRAYQIQAGSTIAQGNNGTVILPAIKLSF
jgi:hypothetical protein